MASKRKRKALTGADAQGEGTLGAPVRRSVWDRIVADDDESASPVDTRTNEELRRELEISQQKCRELVEQLALTLPVGPLPSIHEMNEDLDDMVDEINEYVDMVDAREESEQEEAERERALGDGALHLRR